MAPALRGHRPGLSARGLLGSRLPPPPGSPGLRGSDPAGRRAPGPVLLQKWGGLD